MYCYLEFYHTDHRLTCVCLHCLWGEGESNALEILCILQKSCAKTEDSKIFTEYLYRISIGLMEGFNICYVNNFISLASCQIKKLCSSSAGRSE